MTPNRPKPLNPIKVNLWVDVALFAAILLALAPAFTGLAIHEWLSLALAAAAVLHLLLHWQWIVAVVRRFFARLAGQSRLNFVLNVALFINFTIVTFTGVLISRAALPVFGVVLQRNETWTGLHRLSADLIIFIVGLHVALHWKWILNALRRYVFNPILNVGRSLPASQPAPVTVEVER